MIFYQTHPRILLNDLVLPEDLNRFDQNIARFKTNTLIMEPFERCYVRKDQSIIWLLGSIVLVKDSLENPEYVVVVSVDITEYKNKNSESS